MSAPVPKARAPTVRTAPRYAPLVLLPLILTVEAAAPAGAASAVTPAAACASPAPLGAVEAALISAEAAWGVDEDAFVRGAEGARTALRCVAAPLPPALAARVHRVEGLAAFLRGDKDAADRAFAAARALDPAYTFPEGMVPARNPVRVLYDAAAPSAAVRTAPPPARGVTLWVDGAATRAVPADRPAVVQVQPGATVATTAWLLPDEPLPDYRVRGEGLRVPLLATAGALAAGTGVLWALNATTRASVFEAPTWTEAEARQDATNALGAATVGVGAAALATGAGAFLFARW